MLGHISLKPEQLIAYDAEALAEVGMPPYCAAEIKEQKFAVSFRANQLIDVFTDSAVAKWGIVRAKSTMHGLGKGTIPVPEDSHYLGRISDDGMVTAYTADAKLSKYHKQVDPKEAKIFDVRQHVTLEEVMRGLHSRPPEYVLVNDPPKNNILEVRVHPKHPSLHGSPVAAAVVYSIDLMPSETNVIKAPTVAVAIDQTASPSERRALVAKMKADARVKPAVDVKKPDWWDEKWGEYADRWHDRYAVSKKPNAEAKDFTPYMVLGDDKHHPIRPDQDMLWVPRPLDEVKTLGLTGPLPPEMHVPLNTIAKKSAVLNIIQLSKLLVKLDEIISGVDKDADKNKDKDKRLFPNGFKDLEPGGKFDITALGNITPFEAYRVLMLHSGLKRKYEKLDLMTEVIQHGAENRTPYMPENLTGKMLHFYRDPSRGEMKVALTHNERELVAFVLKPEYLQHHFFEVHRLWDMKVWGPVVKAQIEAKQGDMLSNDTRAIYMAHESVRRSSAMGEMKAQYDKNQTYLTKMFAEVKVIEQKYQGKEDTAECKKAWDTIKDEYFMLATKDIPPETAKASAEAVAASSSKESKSAPVSDDLPAKNFRAVIMENQISLCVTTGADGRQVVTVPENIPRVLFDAHKQLMTEIRDCIGKDSFGAAQKKYMLLSHPKYNDMDKFTKAMTRLEAIDRNYDARAKQGAELQQGAGVEKEPESPASGMRI